ncbi:MAG: Ig-like domain-containing protein [Patescibacteria group bacterium]
MRKQIINYGIILALLSGIVTFAAQRQRHVFAQSPVCQAHVSITPQNQSRVKGAVTFTATAASGFYITRAQFYVMNGATAVSNLSPKYGTASTQFLSIPFDTNSVPNGSYGVRADVMVGTGTTAQTSCPTQPVPMEVFNGELMASLNPSSWSGPTNAPSIRLEAHAGLKFTNGTGQDVTGQATYDWGTSIGSINNIVGNQASFNPGPQIGDGIITVHITYNDLSKDISIPVNVQGYNTETTYPTPTNPDGTLSVPSANGDTSTSPPTNTTGMLLTSPEQLRQGDSTLTSCLVNVFGEANYRERIEANRRLSFADFATTGRCFEQRSNIIPVNLAPIEPDKVKKLPVKKSLSVKRIDSSLTASGSQAIVLSGVADPNKTIIIYVFSEPLVLATRTDKDGKWSYTLENPMEPGEHEAYVTVEGDNAAPVRSSGFAFSIATTTKTKQNPLGLSFGVQKKVDPKYFYIMYAGIVGLIVLIAGMGIWLFVRHKRNIQPPSIGMPTPNVS